MRFSVRAPNVAGAVSLMHHSIAPGVPSGGPWPNVQVCWRIRVFAARGALGCSTLRRAGVPSRNARCRTC